MTKAEALGESEIRLLEVTTWLEVKEVATGTPLVMVLVASVSEYTVYPMAPPSVTSDAKKRLNAVMFPSATESDTHVPVPAMAENVTSLTNGRFVPEEVVLTLTR